ncbi:class I SAM-dependent methyltransferase [Solwaraspora sp. WMMD1047]|uniref:class I SAM-dependent methyltransferase n=1 Tax=Solwaraspora sp. WMMD1047 TaxID=3016102 RepID=UPI002416B366|nr:class I SAM-dependent methyltransferase [Solwaraspora sp. WMMD1047]MDG4832972.1 class I SAM-dependent methyltransferase [Solwaraspora sp. WMMD1047]
MVFHDDYAVSGEYLHVLSLDAWQVLRAPAATALRGARPDAGPLVEVGAGTGLGTEVLAGMAADAEVLAAEPSAMLRAVLLARVAGDADLRQRVSVLEADALSIDLPGRVGALLAMNMIGHLAPAERIRFWARIRQRLVPGAPLVVNIQPPEVPTVIPDSPFASIRIGRYTYQGSGGAYPAGPDAVRWRMRYRTLDERNAVLREQTVNYRWHVVSPVALLAELTRAGFAAEVGESGVVRATVSVERMPGS